MQKESEYSLYADYGQNNYGTMDAEKIAPAPLPDIAPEQIDEVCDTESKL